MTETESAERIGLSIGPGTVGVVAVLVGMGSSFLYPLVVAGLLPGIEQIASTAPRSSHPFVVYLSVIPGPILLTWGAFAYVDDEYTPLTPRRALAALVPVLVSVCLGVSLFAARWTGATPTDIEGQARAPLTLVEALQVELTAVQFVALAAVSAMVVGSVAATRDRWTALATGAVPLGLVVAGLAWGPQHLTPSTVPLVAATMAIPFGIGYVATRSGSRYQTV
ncbi:hypothetical protein SVXHr_0253 [Halorhabdus sp. SVX81]|uniref:hypothetical protein n=1 Tax=Halorhabdus sp. SVX81 TaxID=2978283 RepID=UPI0023DB8720|nr:hypothetical protein [Halorhabdus sp. SVX81]WEL16438.1 hypothetical protein SVXHr_0253 [Halorhabdus sp. SVX81]